MIELTVRDLVSWAITIISVCVIVIQRQKKRALYRPICNALVGLFNSIKTKQIYFYSIQKALEKDDVNKASFLPSIQAITVDLEGIKEHLVAALKTMEISDKKIFKASDFGLTEEEKRQREAFFQKSRAS